MESQRQELRRGLAIHLQSLHIDAQGQPDGIMRAGELATEAKAAAKRKKLELDEAKANADTEIRSLPSKFGLEKVTESAVSSAVTRHPEVMRLSRDAIDAEEFAGKCEAVFTGYSNRKGMIEAEIDLFKANYWGEIQERDMKDASGEAKTDKVERVERRRREVHDGQ